MNYKEKVIVEFDAKRAALIETTKKASSLEEKQILEGVIHLVNGLIAILQETPFDNAEFLRMESDKLMKEIAINVDEYEIVQDVEVPEEDLDLPF